MRGKDDSHLMYAKTCRITPAYAGKSRRQYVFQISIRDHPRLCGEKRPLLPVTIFHDGSPPPMRGKGIGETAYEGNARITPAYAGKRYAQQNLLKNQKDHPRLCGEKL